MHQDELIIHVFCIFLLNVSSSIPTIQSDLAAFRGDLKKLLEMLK